MMNNDDVFYILETLHFLRTGENVLPDVLQNFSENAMENMELLNGTIRSRQIASIVYAMYQIGILKN